jgi:type VI secretion system protein ImpH
MTTVSAQPRASAAPAPPDALDRLRARPWEFDFFQAVWLLERANAGGTPVGQRGPVTQERLRFRPDLSLGFPATDVCGLLEFSGASGAPCHLLEVAFLGLYGGSTPLPLHYAVDILRASDPERATERGGPGHGSGADLLPGSSPMRDFVDVLHHRVISLFYRAWLKYHYERAFAAPQRDVVTDYLKLLIGCPPEYDAATLGVPPLKLLRYAGLLTQRPRSAMSLQGLLFDYWGDIPVQVQQFVGQWVPLEPGDLNHLGAANSRLGVDLTVGDQVYDLGGAFQIRLGPVDLATYETFLPGAARYEQTRALTRLYCADPLAFSLEIVLRAGEVPMTQLTSNAQAGRLGWTSWVRTGDLGETAVTFAAS